VSNTETPGANPLLKFSANASNPRDRSRKFRNRLLVRCSNE
jgi:hypothetical protein